MNDKARGMLVGLAVGDAIGMPVEFEMMGDFEPVEGM
jgi:ADP-ribosylglycohydrolase